MYSVSPDAIIRFSGPICSLPSQRFASDFQSSEITKWPAYRMQWCRFTTTMNRVSKVSNSQPTSLLFPSNKMHIICVKCLLKHEPQTEILCAVLMISASSREELSWPRFIISCDDSPCLTARKATRTYNSDVLHNMNSCFFCGEDCGRCTSGFTLAVSSQMSSRPVSSVTHSLVFLFLGVAAFFYWSL